MELIDRKEKTYFTILISLAILVWIGLIAATFGLILIYVLFGALFYLIAHSGLIAHLRGDAVVISPTQYPDLEDRIKRCAQTLNMPLPHQAFLLHGNGLFNAFATRFLSKNYIALYSDVVDALEDRPDALDFYIGHELGHVKRKHVVKHAFLLPVMWLPLIGAAYARACELSCDRHGLACCRNADDARLGLAALAAGGKRWKTLQQNEYARQADHPGFWMSFHELCSDYPWLSKRMLALLQLSENREPQLPGRNGFAYVLAAFVPRTGVPGAGGAMGLLMLFMIAVFATASYEAYQKQQAALNNPAAYMQDGEIYDDQYTPEDMQGVVEETDETEAAGDAIDYQDSQQGPQPAPEAEAPKATAPKGKKTH
jgi:Zn-dependent protease with chaperone function